MAGALRKTMVYLGLAEEDERYPEDAYEEDREDRDHGDHGRGGPEPREREEPTPLRRAPAASTAVEEEQESSRRAAVTPLPRRTPVREVVNDVEVTGVHRITTIHPRTYNEAKRIGENFRQGTPVIMNLSDLDDADAKRLVDFAAGLVFGLQGAIERVTNKVFLLSPADVEVTTEDSDPKNAPRDGLFNQN